MNKIPFNKPLKVHFIGIGGISMSGLAEILKKENFEVSGSDIKSSNITDKLKQLGIKVHIGHNASHISQDMDLIIHTAAIKTDNPEYQEALRNNLVVIDRATLLGQIMNNYKYPIAISGTHGKTTTTSMVSHVLLKAKKDPTITVGGILNIINGNIRVGKSNYFVTEACEYYNSFLKFNPYIGVILNIEEDHLDFFKDLNDIMDSFKKFALKIPVNGTLIINGDIDNINQIINDLPCNIITFGSDIANHDYSANHIEFNELAHGSFDLIYKGNKIDRVYLKVTGMHNIFNALS
ncbi:MAG: UDP-N-acetylmuramate--L-alanine ligase, partial [Eubacteriales bacterium]